MSAPNQQVKLARLLGDPRGSREDASTESPTAAEVIEQLRLWEVADQPRVAQAQTERPYLLLNMASTVDGRATIGGRSGPIGNRADHELFHALRTTVDAVLVGAGTVRAEHYGRLVRTESARELRRARGLAEEPLACIVSASLALPAQEIPLLTDPAARVAILTPSPASLPECAGAARYVRAAHEGRLDLQAALTELRRSGVRTVLCEGGPHLNAQLLAEGLVDELFLSLAPKLAGGDAVGESLRIVSGGELRPPVELELLGALESEGQLLLRYRARRAGEPRVEPAGGGGGAGREVSSESPAAPSEPTGGSSTTLL